MRFAIISHSLWGKSVGIPGMLGGLRHLIAPWILAFWNVDVFVLLSPDSWHSPCSLHSLPFVPSDLPLLLDTPRAYEGRKERKRDRQTGSSILTSVLFFLRSVPTLSAEEGRVICCSRSHPPLSIPLFSVTSGKMSKRVDFSEMGVLIGVVLGG